MSSKRTIGFFLNGDYRGLSLAEAFQDLASIGYDAAEIPYSRGCAAQSRELAENAGLLLSEIVVQRDFVTRDPDDGKRNLEETVACIRECGAAGVKILNLFTGPVPWGRNPLTVEKEISAADAWKTLTAAFDVLAAEASENHVVLAVENVWGHLCHDFFTAHYLISRYPAEAVGVNFDPSHDVLSGNTDMRFLLTAWGERCRHIHLKDAAGIMQAGRFVFPMLGEGAVNWADFRTGLDEIGYAGTMSVEFESPCLGVYFDNDLGRAARESMRAVRMLGLKED